GVAPCFLINSSAKASISIVVIPGFIIFAISLWHATNTSAAACICAISRSLFLVIIKKPTFRFLLYIFETIVNDVGYHSIVYHKLASVSVVTPLGIIYAQKKEKPYETSHGFSSYEFCLTLLIVSISSTIVVSVCCSYDD